MNRQVPNKTYTIVGNGKVAKHFAHYFNLLKIHFNCWNRNQSIDELKQLIINSDSVLLLIADNAIEPFIRKHSFLHNKILIHFSGSLLTKHAFGCHPLMAFAHMLYDLSTYQSFPFICDDGVEFTDLFPLLSNKSFQINNKSKAYYHAMCVIAGNFSQTLMCESQNKLSKELQLPDDILFPYLLQNTKNFIHNSDKSATGPMQRNDISTIDKHLIALKSDPLESIYHSFLQLHSTYHQT